MSRTLPSTSSSCVGASGWSFRSPTPSRSRSSRMSPTGPGSSASGAAREADRGLHHRPVRLRAEAAMARHFHEELDALKQTLLAMGGLVEDQIRRVMRALIERDSELAQDVIDRDRQVNAYDVEIDEKCVELLALHQPTAGDLRFITTAMKIVTDLERIGDQAVNIAQRTIELNPEPQLKPYVDLPRMAEKAQRMMKESLDAFVSRDTELARRVCGEDADVDALKEQIFRELLTDMMEDPKTIPRAIRLILVSRFLERVADHATNIAEMVIYMVESKMVRHMLA